MVRVAQNLIDLALVEIRIDVEAREQPDLLTTPVNRCIEVERVNCPDQARPSREILEKADGAKDP